MTPLAVPPADLTAKAGPAPTGGAEGQLLATERPRGLGLRRDLPQSLSFVWDSVLKPGSREETAPASPRPLGLRSRQLPV